MFERFTDRARKAMCLANSFAGECGSMSLDDIHILVGVCREGGGVAASVLKELGTTSTAVEVAVGHLLVPRSDQTRGRLPRTVIADGMIHGAIAAAESLGNNYVGTEHLLIALTRNFYTCSVLDPLGVTHDKVLACVKRFQADANAKATPTPSPLPSPTLGGMLAAVLDPKATAALLDALLAENGRLRAAAVATPPADKPKGDGVKVWS